MLLTKFLISYNHSARIIINHRLRRLNINHKLTFLDVALNNNNNNKIKIVTIRMINVRIYLIV